MKNEGEKKGLLARLTGRKKPKQSPCCGGFVVETVPDKEGTKENAADSPKPKKKSCCG
ncbi:MAG TPA: hypothetical protein P5119_01125 [Candidatus Aminicenantes bacterium]|nr:hypothetical protein [Candidatus Aminicenantes bacterium]HRY63927.1 hypothetical protein [Candidatus Aminicenantes bacterium]HRZ70840.1 hypothetical protein [Candidatus Aminicenantes bacterium]